jgi:carbamoyltransferase
MSFAPDANRAGAETFAATVHVDGKARLQTVADDWGRQFRHLLEEFKDITGVPGLVNTSLNMKGQPLAESPLDALEILRQSDLDGVLIEDTLVLKS